MTVTPRVLTPTSVGRFVASIRAVAASSDGLVVCGDCRRHMSDMATTCPHCSAVNEHGAVATLDAEAPGVAAGPALFTRRDVRSISLMVFGLAVASYLVSRLAGL